MAFSTTRFAPSPTGPLHLGHVAHMVYLWGLARKLGARVVPRIEDHDRGRRRPEHEAGILDDVAWLGFRPDRVAPRQSERETSYLAALDRLDVYRCDCTRREIAERCAIGPDGEPRYDGRCRERGLREGGWRARIEPGEEVFKDGLLGERRQNPAEQCGDLLVRDRDGQWTYQFAVVVDDLTDGVDVVIRGEDLPASTGRQILLARMLGRAEPPRFFHHPLVRDAGGEKLSKRRGSAALAARRQAGADPADVLAEAVGEIVRSARAGALY